MPNLNNIVSFINSSLQADQFKSRRYQGSWNLIADPIRTTTDTSDTIRPCIVDDEGKCTDLSPNEEFPLIVFHRADAPQYSVDPQDDYGQEGYNMNEEVEMRMIFWGDRSKLKSRVEDVVAAAVIDFPKELNATQITSNNIQSEMVRLEFGSVNIESESIYNREWSGTPYPLNPNQFLFSISYRIVQTYNTKCFTLCQ